MTEAAHTPLSAEALDEAERWALITAVVEARTDPRPEIPHEEVRAEMLAGIEALECGLAASFAAQADSSSDPLLRVMQGGKAE